MKQYELSFNGNRIDQLPGIKLYFYDFTQLPERNINIHKLARRSLSIITSAEFTQKAIPVWLDVCGGNRQATEALVTNLKALVQPMNGRLDVLLGGQEVTYTATMNEFNIEWNAQNAYIQIVFLASTPIGSHVDTQTLFQILGNTLPSISATFNVEGSFFAEPIINVSFNSVTDGTGKKVNLFNAGNNQGLTITGNFDTGSLLEIDGENMTILLDGASIDFEGLFPTFPPGSQAFSYSDTFGSRDVDITATYRQKLI